MHAREAPVVNVSTALGVLYGTAYRNIIALMELPNLSPDSQVEKMHILKSDDETSN